MPSPKLIMFFAGIMFFGILFSWFMGGIWFGNDSSVMQSLTAFKIYYPLGKATGFGVPWVNIDFFTKGIPHLVMFDYAFFGGGYSIFRYIFYIASVGLVWGFVAITISILSGFYTRR